MLSLAVRPLYGMRGLVQGLVLVVRDITAPKGVEARLRQSQKLAAIGTLAPGIAHEFNNVLASIIGFTELTVDDLPQKVGRGTTWGRSSRPDCGPSRSSSSCWPSAARAHPCVSLCTRPDYS